MFLKSDLFYFVLVAKAYGFCLRARPVNSDHILNVLETVKFVFCLQIHALAECTMNSKFCILHSAPVASCSIQNFSFIVHSARACICKGRFTLHNFCLQLSHAIRLQLELYSVN